MRPWTSLAHRVSERHSLTIVDPGGTRVSRRKITPRGQSHHVQEMLPQTVLSVAAPCPPCQTCAPAPVRVPLFMCPSPRRARGVILLRWGRERGAEWVVRRRCAAANVRTRGICVRATSRCSFNRWRHRACTLEESITYREEQIAHPQASTVPRLISTIPHLRERRGMQIAAGRCRSRASTRSRTGPRDLAQRAGTPRMRPPAKARSNHELVMQWVPAGWGRRAP